jgi:hypothetical protein
MININDSEDEVDKKYTEILQKEIQNIHTQNDNQDNIIDIFQYYDSNSPLSLSSNNSEIGEEDIFENNFEKEYFIEKQIIDNTYTNKYTSELDVLINYITGQKKIYFYANFIMDYRHRFLTNTSMLFTVSISIFTPIFGTREWGILFIVILNALTSVMVFIINQFQLEASAREFSKIAQQFDQLQTKIEHRNRIIVFMEEGVEKKDALNTYLEEIEHERSKILELNNLEIPISIRYDFPLLINFNIFSFVKKINSVKKTLIEKFLKAKKEAKRIFKKSHTKNINSREMKRLQYLTELKESIKTDLNHCINAYDYMNDLFSREINVNEFKRWWTPFTIKQKNIYNNPIVDDYIKFITQP